MSNHSAIIFSIERLLSVVFMKMVKRRQNPKATILVYHNVASENCISKLQFDSVSLEEFRRQMLFLRGKSFNIISLQDLVSKLINKKNIAPNTVVITFDDGYKSTYVNAYPILKANSIPATVFLAAGFIKENGRFSWLKHSLDAFTAENLSPMNWEDVEELHKGGIEIGSHSLYHQFLPELDDRRIEEEIVKSREVISDRIGVSPKTFALPFSFPIEHRAWRSFGNVVRNTLETAGYASCCSMIRGHIGPESNLFCLRRIPIVKMDTLLSFQAKLLGNYSWTRHPQHLYQSFFKKYGDVRKNLA